MYGIQIGSQVNWKDRGMTQNGFVVESNDSIVKVYNKDSGCYEYLPVNYIVQSYIPR